MVKKEAEPETPVRGASDLFWMPLLISIRRLETLLLKI
jgi:hypothetical protein